jgi:putative SOS response-associated peptidase YedK
LFDGLRFPKLVPRYNICPTQNIISVRQNAAGQNEVAQLRWGLVPFWAKDLRIGAQMINARSETAATKPSFRNAFKKHRCLVLADGYYEWIQEGSKKQPYYISRRDDQPFCMAGLWESWKNKSTDDAKPVETCAILTTSANAIMEPLHDRMPVILDSEAFDFWLDKDICDREKLEALMVPYIPDELQTFPVDTLVNRPVNDSPQCIVPI